MSDLCTRLQGVTLLASPLLSRQTHGFHDLTTSPVCVNNWPYVKRTSCMTIELYKRRNKLLLLLLLLLLLSQNSTSSGSSGRVREAAFGGHLFYDLFSQGWGHGPFASPGFVTEYIVRLGLSHMCEMNTPLKARSHFNGDSIILIILVSLPLAS